MRGGMHSNASQREVLTINPLQSSEDKMMHGPDQPKPSRNGNISKGFSVLNQAA